MSEEHVHRSLLARAGWFFAFIPLGWLSILLLALPVSNEMGMVSLRFSVCVLVWVLVGVASTAGFAGCCPRLSWFALMGWLLGQGGLLVWKMTPPGFTPRDMNLIQVEIIARPLLYAMVIVALLNWPVVPGFVVGRIVKLVRAMGKSPGKTPPTAEPVAAK